MAQDLKDVLLSPFGFTAVELGTCHPSSLGISICEAELMTTGTGIGVVSLLLSAILEPFPGSENRRILATDLG